MTDPRPCPALRRKPGATDAEACGRPSGDGFICNGCTRYLERTLAELPSWLGELDTALTRQARTSRPDGGKATKRFEQPLPFDPNAAELLHTVRNELSTAVRGLCESRGIQTPRIERTADMALWLVDHVDSIRQQPEAPEMVTWARTLRDAIRWQVDNLGTRFAGPCTARIQTLSLETNDGQVLTPITAGTQCGADLRTRPGDKVIRCRACGATYDPVERMAWALHQTRDALETGRVIADALSVAMQVRVTWSMVRQMEYRGEIAWLTTDDVGRKLYRVGDVVDVVSARIAAGKLSDRRERIGS